jgi:CBS domain-containing protein
MSHNPIYITPSTTLDEAMAIVSNQRIRHLPVVQNGDVLGMVSSGDLTHWLVEDRGGEIRELVNIAGRRRDRQDKHSDP